MDFAVHQIANEFPEFEREDYERLKADLQANGQLVPIELYHGQILDGRNRYRALRELGIEPLLRSYDGPDPLGRAISLNLLRRHMTTEQRAKLADALVPAFEAQAAERKEASLARPGEKFGSSDHLARASNVDVSRRQRSESTSTELSKTERAPQSTAQAAAAVGISQSTLDRYRYVKKHKPELLQDVHDEILTIPQAVDKVHASQERDRAHQAAAQRALAAGATPPTPEQIQAEADRKTWEELNKLIDQLYPLTAQDPALVARLIPSDAKARVLRLVQKTERWCTDLQVNAT